MDPGLNLVSDSFPTDLKRIADNVHYKGKRADTEPKTSAGNDLKVNGAGIGDRRKKLREQAFGSNFVGKRAKEMEVSFSRFILEWPEGQFFISFKHFMDRNPELNVEAEVVDESSGEEDDPSFDPSGGGSRRGRGGSVRGGRGGGQRSN